MPGHDLHPALHDSLRLSPHPKVFRAEARECGGPGQEQCIAGGLAIQNDKPKNGSLLHSLLQKHDHILHHRSGPLLIPVLHEHLDHH